MMVVTRVAMTVPLMVDWKVERLVGTMVDSLDYYLVGMMVYLKVVLKAY